ncbi:MULTISPECIES: UDP-2,3-diacylglucosamine diphosphatase [Erwinia]|uniref:UDP-2,3-diacylglucosamine hydrolase n=1 Tax=Erwinia papayae TaxID=206499 RepID=A0ABV3N5T1_9GAMM|nr:UDP-2,3-diacylglucosamine diphosphatase [Erwinia mallotivora]
MPHTLFIADLHLCKEEPAITAGFLAFLQREACQAEALYILGDLFEAWIGDDFTQPLHTEIAAALSALTQAGIPCYFIHGNRDFLLGKNYAAACGMTLLPEEKVLALYGKRILIMHGDTLCTDDQAYQRFRRKVHQRWLQKLFLTLPLFIRKRIATRMRADSKQANSGKDSAIMDVNQDAVIRTMTHHDVHYLIHGHTHRPAIHQLTVNGQPAQRLVSGAWHHEGWLIRVSESETTLISFPFEK